jgi:hypothetical protein
MGIFRFGSACATARISRLLAESPATIGRPGLAALQHRFPRIEPQSAQRRSRVARVAFFGKQGANPLFEKLFPFIGVRVTNRPCTQEK